MKRSRRKHDTWAPKAMSELRAVTILRYGHRCWRCGKDLSLELHHNAKRGGAGRYNERTTIMLCHECHVFAGQCDTLWQEEVRQRDPVFYDYCQAIRHRVLTEKPDPKAEYERLHAIGVRLEREW